uniref:phosphorylase kinase n=1 Tax=Strigamia maritima TaxID=126957 RepID=T1INR2_STRMM
MDLHRNSFYAVEWLDSCYRLLAVPNPVLEKVLNKVNEKLSVVVKGQMDKPGKKQILFSLLGSHFIRQYFSNERYEEKYLLPPHMDADTRLELTEEVKFWLMEQLKKIENELGFNKNVENGTQDADVTLFITQIQTIYKTHLDARIEELKKLCKEKNQHKTRVDFDIESPLHALGEGLLAIGLKDPFKMAQILKTWQQRFYPLPGRLRMYVWDEFMFSKHGRLENVATTEVVSDYRIRFSRTVNMNVSNLKLEDSKHSTLFKQINDAVAEVYDQSHSLRDLNSESHVTLSCNILNTVHVANGTFNPLYIYWVCPLQLVFVSDMSEEDELMNMAMHLDLLARHCPLAQSEIFSLAKQVMQSLKSYDPFLHEHLYDVAAKKIKINAKDFPVECLHQDKTEANKIASEMALFAGKDLPSNRLTLFENPEIFIRKWLITVFVSALTPFVCLFVWDYIFLGKWQRRRFHDFCIVLLGMLKNWFYRAKDYRGLKQVFFEEPSRLYTNDIRRAWLHWQDGGNFEMIPELNSNIKLAITPISDGGDSVMAVTPKINRHRKLSAGESDLEDELTIPDVYLRTRRQSSFFPEGVAAWIPFNSDTLKSLPVSEGIAEAFDLYIDSIRFMPDCSSLVKITGKIYNVDFGKNEDDKFPDYAILTLTDLHTSYRNPEFRYRITINEGNDLMNPESVVLFQIYTLDRLSKFMVQLGSVIFPLFDTAHKKPLLKYGGHQLRLRLGAPKNSKLFYDWAEKSEPIPAASLLIRVLPQSEDYLDAPEYDNGYYLSESTRPTISEWNLYRHYLLADDLLMTVKQLALKLLRDERHIGRVTDDELEDWIRLKFEIKTGQVVKNVDLSRFVYYGIRSGVRVQIKHVYCLPEFQDNNYIQVLVRLLPGNNTRKIKPTHEGWGSDEKFTTKFINSKSYMRSPSWDDQASLLHPFLDNNSTLLVELFGLEVVYERDPTGIGYGNISSKSGSHLKINLDFPLAWTVVRLFNKGFINCGLHIYPLFKGKITDEIITKLQHLSLEKVLKDSTDNGKIKLHDGSVIEFALWDGNFIDSEHAPLPKNREILELCGIKAQDESSYTLPQTAHKVSWLVSSVMPTTQLTAVKKREIYNREKDLFLELVLKKYLNLMISISIEIMAKDEITDDGMPAKDVARDFYARYEPKEILGRGVSSTVRRCIEKETGKEYAAKIIDISGDVDDPDGTYVREATKREIQVLRLVSGHPHIVELHDVFESNTFIFLIFELCKHGELFDYLTSVVTLSEKKTRFMMRQLFEAVKFIHDKNIVHRDLKPENILLDDNMNIKLTDFGFARVLGADEKLYDLCGTPGYLAPELLKSSMNEDTQGYGKEVDLWACGVIMYTVLVGCPPFWHRKQMIMLRQIMEGKYSFDNPEWEDITQTPKDLISGLLVIEPMKRLTIRQAIAHDFFQVITPLDAVKRFLATHYVNPVIVPSQEPFNARRKFRVAIICVRAIIRLKRLRFTPEPLAVVFSRQDPYKVKALRKVIDGSAFLVYGHWVKKGETQNRAALFENHPKTEYSRATEISVSLLEAKIL